MHQAEFGRQLLRAMHDWAGNQEFVDDVVTVIADRIGLTRKTLSTRIRNGGWTWEEIRAIRRILSAISYATDMIDNQLKD